MFQKVKTGVKSSGFAKFIKVALIVLVVVTVAYLSGAVVNKIINDRQNKQAEIFQQTVNESSTLVGQRKYDEATALWQNYLTDGPPEQYLFQAHFYLGTVFQSGGKSVEARDEFRAAQTEAQTEQERYAAILAIAQTSEVMGDKTTAVEYYKQAIELRKNSTDIQKDLDIDQLESKIKQLNGN